MLSPSTQPLTERAAFVAESAERTTHRLWLCCRDLAHYGIRSSGLLMVSRWQRLAARLSIDTTLENRPARSQQSPAPSNRAIASPHARQPFRARGFRRLAADLGKPFCVRRQQKLRNPSISRASCESDTHQSGTEYVPVAVLLLGQGWTETT